MISPRRQQAIDDYNQYGDYQSGTYNGIEWEAIRSYDGFGQKQTPSNAWMFHWCGYVKMGKNLKEEHEEFMAESGSECTYNSKGTIGFDCNHYTDYPASHKKENTYKDFPYVLNIIKNTINKITLE